MLGMARLASARHRFRAALMWSRRAAAANPYSSQAYGLMGDAQLELGRYGRAVATYQRMVNLRPDLSSYARVAYARDVSGDTAGAVKAMKLAIDAAGTPQDAAWANYQLGELHFRRGRLSAARRAYRDGRRLAPDYVLPETGLAKVMAASGNLRGGARRLAEVVARYPVPEFTILLGDIYSAAGRDAPARSQYDLVRATQKLYEANGVNTDLEMALFDADHRLSPRAALARARAEYRKRKSVFVADALAWALYANGRYRKAKSFADEALRLGTRDAMFHFHAGMIARRLGRPTLALRHLTTALAINPHFSFIHAPTARRVLARI